jgi:hypothetical protein
MDCESDDSDYEERDRALTMCTFTTASPKKKSLAKQSSCYSVPTNSVFSAKMQSKLNNNLNAEQKMLDI